MASATNSENFDLKLVHDAFFSCLLDCNDISLTMYLDGYRELNKFFQLMGAVFSFVSSDISQKIDILEELVENEIKQDNDNNSVAREITMDDNTENTICEKIKQTHIDNGNEYNFKSCKSMMDYELRCGLLNKKDYVSGSRTLLRLHRGLDFIRVFLASLSDLDNSEKTSTVCQEAYNQTLAKYHPWIIRKGAIVAMYSMPTRENLLKRVCQNENDVQKTLDVLPKMLEAAHEVYDRVQGLYEHYDLLNLP